MDNLICKAISELLIDRKDLLRIPLRQKAKFEGWLKFELAHRLIQIGMESVEVETKACYNRNATDITFFHKGDFYSIELKTSNTNWKNEGVRNCKKPITKNIQSIISDAIKLNSDQGFVAFILFPIPLHNKSWELYIEVVYTF